MQDQAKNKVVPTTPVPMVGAVINDIPWTGGPRISNNKYKIPASPFCSRPTDNYHLSKIYDKATLGAKVPYDGEEGPITIF